MSELPELRHPNGLYANNTMHAVIERVVLSSFLADALADANDVAARRAAVVVGTLLRRDGLFMDIAKLSAGGNYLTAFVVAQLAHRVYTACAGDDAGWPQRAWAVLDNVPVGDGIWLGPWAPYGVERVGRMWRAQLEARTASDDTSALLPDGMPAIELPIE